MILNIDFIGIKQKRYHSYNLYITFSPNQISVSFKINIFFEKSV